MHQQQKQQQQQQQKQQHDDDDEDVQSSERDNSDVVTEPGSNDVMLGRKSTVSQWAGNKRYQTEIDANVMRYHHAASRSDRGSIVLEIISNIESRGGRFLEQKGKNGPWYIADLNKVRKKVGQALRYQTELLKHGVATVVPHQTTQDMVRNNTTSTSTLSSSSSELQQNSNMWRLPVASPAFSTTPNEADEDQKMPSRIFQRPRTVDNRPQGGTAGFRLGDPPTIASLDQRLFGDNEASGLSGRAPGTETSLGVDDRGDSTSSSSLLDDISLSALNDVFMDADDALLSNNNTTTLSRPPLLSDVDILSALGYDPLSIFQSNMGNHAQVLYQQQQFAYQQYQQFQRERGQQQQEQQVQQRRLQESSHPQDARGGQEQELGTFSSISSDGGQVVMGMANDRVVVQQRLTMVESLSTPSRAQQSGGAEQQLIDEDMEDLEPLYVFAAGASPGERQAARRNNRFAASPEKDDDYVAFD